MARHVSSAANSGFRRGLTIAGYATSRAAVSRGVLASNPGNVSIARPRMAAF